MKSRLLLLLCILYTSVSISQGKESYRAVKPTKAKQTKLILKGADYKNKQKLGNKSISLSSKGGTLTGATQGFLSISNTGAANYDIPITVPPGLNGVEPKLSLSFNSQSGNGIAGWGWNLSGVSVITRIPSTQFHDNNIDAVDYDYHDRFALDGQRLILKSGTYGANGAVYQTENYSNLKIESVGSFSGASNNGTNYFKVYYPDGSIAHFGDNSSSSYSGGPTDYAISFWENPQGVRINYEYGSGYPKRVEKISYGTTGINTPINEIEFDYTGSYNHQRWEQAYIGGINFERRYVLQKIIVRGDGNTVFRNYNLNYDPTFLGYPRLISVQEDSGATGTSKAPITFDYGTETPATIEAVDKTFGNLTVGNIEQRNAEVVPVDISGDGQMDFLVYPTTGPDAKKKFWLFDNLQNTLLNSGTEANVGDFKEIFPVTWLNYDFKMLSNQGVVVIQNNGESDVKFRVMSSGGAAQPIVTKYEKNWTAPTYKPENYCGTNTSIENRVPLKYISGDFNGDGLSSVIALETQYTTTSCQEVPATNDPTCPNKIYRDGVAYCCYGCSTSTNNSSSSKAHLINLDRRLGGNPASYIGNLTENISGIDKLRTADVNGDGKTDILLFKNGSVFVYSLNNENTLLELLWEKSHGNIDTSFPILLGDYNGDGKTDFMQPSENSSYNFYVFLSNGEDFTVKSKNFPFDYQETNFNIINGVGRSYNLIPIDIDGDGKTDIVEYNTTTNNSGTNGYQRIYVYHNKPSDIDSPQFVFGGNTTVNGPLKHYPIPIFLNNDQSNNNLEFAAISDNKVTSIKFNKDHRKDIRLEEVENNGIVTKIKYDKVDTYYSDYQNDPSYFTSYSPRYGQIFPFVNVNVASTFEVVRELEESGSGILRKKKFYYEGAVSHVGGLGFIGFEVIKKSNWFGNNSPSLWTITKFDPMLRGAVIEEITANNFSNNPSSFMSKTNYFYDYTLIANPSSSNAPEYDDYLERYQTISGPQQDIAENYILLQNGFYANGSNGEYSAKILPPEQQPGDAGYAGAVDIRLKRIEKDDGLTGVFSQETYVYDAYNNPTTTTTTFPGGSRVLSYLYSNNTGATDNTYHVGKPLRMVETLSLNGNTFSTTEEYDYDNNLVTEIRRKGNGTDWVTQVLAYDNANGNILSKTTSANGLAPRVQTYEYSNTYNKRFLTKSTDIDGLFTTFQYDAVSGDLINSTNIYGQVTSYIHDSWGRVTKETDYLNNDTDHVYTTLGDGGLQHNINYADGSKDVTYYNAYGWETRSGSLSLNNQWVYQDTEYYISGKVERESEPHNGSPAQWNTIIFDEYGRPITQQLYTGRTITITYSGLSSTVNDGVKSVTTTLDALGNTVKVQDPGGTVDYTYHASGILKTADYDGHIVSVGVDGWGRKTSLTDPSAGTYNYTYDDFGQLRSQSGPNGTTTYEYDDYGKPTSKNIVGSNTDMEVTYLYDNTTKQLKKITGVDNTNSGRTYVYDYLYDSYKRPYSIKENTGLANYEYQITYDTNYGRVEKETYITNLIGGPSKTLTTRNVYDTSGILKEIWNDGTPDKLWEINQINARGQALTVTLGNGIIKNKNYDSYGYLTKIEDKESGTNPTVALHTEYDFDAQKGTLKSRENFAFNWTESFGYDNLNRLTTITGSVAKTVAYDTRGNIDSNTDIGDYSYANTAKKFQLTEIDPNSLGETYFQAHPTQQITYNAFKKPVTIHETGHGRVDFEYGPMLGRSTAYYGGEDQDRALRKYRKHYSRIIPVEIVEDIQTGKDKIISYIGGDAYSAPIAHIKTTGTGAIDEYHYIHRDYLGSILAITDADGDVKEEFQFGAWGSVDQFLDSNGGTTFGHDSLLGRGYTGHEHFFEVSLIHMNGRMYDPLLGRFLSPDNYIQDPFDTQNYNRYGYVLNNPLMYTDVNGEEFFSAIIAFLAVAWPYITGAAIIAAAAIWGDWDGAVQSSSFSNPAPAPSNTTTNTQNASSMSNPDPPRGNGNINDGGGRIPLNIPAIESSIHDGNVATVFDNMSVSTSGAYGVSQIGSRDPLQGIPKPDNFVPNDGVAPDESGFNITTEDVVDTVLDFIPFVGSGKDIYEGIRDGDGWQVALGAGSLILDVFTLGGASIVKGGIKTGIKAGGKALANKTLKTIGGKLPRGGKTFNQYKKAFWKRTGNKKRNLDVLTNDKTGQVWKQYEELHHRFIPQRLQKKYDLPNWLINNDINLRRINSLEHAKIDPYRARFAPKWVKDLYDLKYK